jgi:hypothetical protein
MATDGADPIVDQVEAQAKYETLREVANQLIGVLVARERAGADAPSTGWSDQRRAIRARLHTIEPGTPDVDDALDEWAALLRQLRAGGA